MKVSITAVNYEDETVDLFVGSGETPGEAIKNAIKDHCDCDDGVLYIEISGGKKDERFIKAD